MAGNLRAFLAEFLGTFAWVFFCAGAVCAQSALGLGASSAAAAQGAGIAGAFALFGRWSPGGFNPAFTVALAGVGRLDWMKAALCVVCQLLGAALAGLMLGQVFAHSPVVDSPPYLGAPSPSSLLGFRGATLVEAVLTFFLSLAAYRAVGGEDAGETTRAALVVGLVAAAAVLSVGALTGAVMNPARAFGPAAASGFWTQHYVYWFGPLAGAAVGVGLSRHVLER